MTNQDRDATSDAPFDNTLDRVPDADIPPWLQIYDALLDNFRLTAEEASRATDSYYEEHSADMPLLPPAALAAAADAYTIWATTADPAILAEREAQQRVAGIDADIRYARSYLDLEQSAADLSLSTAYAELDAAQGRAPQPIGLGRDVGPEPDPAEFLFNTAYLDGAAAAISELLVSSHPDYLRRNASPVEHGATPADNLAAAEAAISLLRADRDVTGYSEDDAAIARALRGVLDAAQVWDTVPSSALTDEGWRPLEQELQPDRIRQRLGWDDSVVLEAGFAGATVVIQRIGETNGTAKYELFAPTQNGQGPLHDVDSVALGMIAAGDRTPKAEHNDMYGDLGAQVRQHLVGLADAVAAHRQQLLGREMGRLETMQAPLLQSGRSGHERSL